MNIFVKPKEGLIVRRPDNNRQLAPEGESVPKSSFWLRRIADGDVLLIEKKEDAPDAKKKPAAKEVKEGGVK